MLYLEDQQDQRIEGILLQMLCEHYERRQVEGKGIQLLDLAQIGDPEQVVSTYYHEKIDNLPAAQRLLARRLIEDGLVSEGEEDMRLSLHENFIFNKYKVEKALLENLVDSRLLRSEPFLRGGYTYELSHDRLVPPVLKARRERWQEETRQQAELKEKELVATRRQLRLVRGLLILALLALITAAYFAWDANQKKQEADNAKAEAQTNLTRAKEQTDVAKKALADAQREFAAKERLRFTNMETRANTILDVGGCPIDLLTDMRAIAESHPDSIRMRDQLIFLQNKNPSCR